MTGMTVRNSGVFAIAAIMILAAATVASSQTTSFTYQGRLTDGGTAANGNYDLQFALWDSLSGGAQVGSTQNLNTVAVSNGVFTVSLDFGANAFPGASRFLEISARPAGSGSFTLLSPRQQITSTPYAVRSLTSASADSVPASGVPAGSGNYIQNTGSPQSGNLNITGNATVGQTLSGNVVNAATQFNIGGSRILSGSNLNLFAGVGSGAANTTGKANTFVGHSAGAANTQGSFNNFLGSGSGSRNINGSSNAFFGGGAGVNNTDGGDNSFFGSSAGQSNQTGNYNTVVGSFANLNETNLTNATAIGACSVVSQSNSLILGSINSASFVCPDVPDTNVGIGTAAPSARLHIRANGKNILLGDPGCGPGFIGIGFGSSLSGCGNFALLGGDGNTYINRPAGGAIIFREGNGSNQVEIRPGGTVGIAVLDGGGGTALCRNGVAAISTCSSSLRYKTAVKPFSGGLQLINRLHPVSFNWKSTQQPDIGLVAEEVAKVEPRLTFKNQNGEIEGVNYSHLTAVLINAVKEQQAQIKAQQEQIKQQQDQAKQQTAALAAQQQQLRVLQKLVCRSHQRAAVCK